MKADGFLVMARGPAAEMTRAKQILGTSNPTINDLHTDMKSIEPSAPAHSAV